MNYWKTFSHYFFLAPKMVIKIYGDGKVSDVSDKDLAAVVMKGGFWM